MILYTSGTTRSSREWVTTHTNITAQISTLVSCWEWASSDHILCVLPFTSATRDHQCSVLRFVEWCYRGSFTGIFCLKCVPKNLGGRINLFMAVPTIYFKLIAYWESLPAEQQTLITTHLSRFRLMVSGSAALPESIIGAKMEINQWSYPTRTVWYDGNRYGHQ